MVSTPSPSIFDKFRETQGEVPQEPPVNSKDNVFQSFEKNFGPIQREEAPKKEPSRPIGEQLRNVPGMLAREAVATTWALPHATSEAWRFLAGKLQKMGEDQAAKEGREISPREWEFTNKVVNYIPDLINGLNEKAPTLFPTHKEAKERLTEAYKEKNDRELPAEASGRIERAAEGAGRALPIAAFPGTAAMKAAAIGTSAATEALDLPEGQKLAANLTLPVLVDIIAAIATKRYIPSNAEAAALREAGHSLGMTDEQLAPLLATEGQVDRHRHLASGTKTTRQAFEQTGDVLGTVLQDIQNGPRAAQSLSPQSQRTLTNKLQGIADDMRNRTHALSPKEDALLKFLDESIHDIAANGSSGKQLIGTWRSMNRVGGGKTELRRITEPLLEAMESINPTLAKEFKESNALYSRYMRNLREISPTQFDAFISAGEMQQLLGAVFSGQPITFGKAALNAASLGALKRISSNILTSPQAQSLVRNFGHAVRNGSQAASRSVANQLKNYVQKNMPEEYDKVDWDSLEAKG